MTFDLANPIVNSFLTQNVYINFAEFAIQDIAQKLNFNSHGRDRSWPSELHSAGLLDII